VRQLNSGEGVRRVGRTDDEAKKQTDFGWEMVGLNVSISLWVAAKGPIHPVTSEGCW
jgi:hypothetical protein